MTTNRLAHSRSVPVREALRWFINRSTGDCPDWNRLYGAVVRTMDCKGHRLPSAWPEPSMAGEQVLCEYLENKAKKTLVAIGNHCIDRIHRARAEVLDPLL